MPGHVTQVIFLTRRNPNVSRLRRPGAIRAQPCAILIEGPRSCFSLTFFYSFTLFNPQSDHQSMDYPGGLPKWTALKQTKIIQILSGMSTIERTGLIIYLHSMYLVYFHPHGPHAIKFRNCTSLTSLTQSTCNQPSQQANLFKMGA